MARRSEGARGPRQRSRRLEVLNTLREADAPLGVTETAARVGVHPNTVRFHLDALIRDGLVETAAEERTGPGRPRTVYAPRQGMDRGGTRSYLLLARMLLGQFLSGQEEPGAAATEAGRTWGRHLVEEPPPYQRPTADEAVARLNALLADLGFDPHQAPGRRDGEGRAEQDGLEKEDGPSGFEPVRLRHCPFLELAEEYGSVVCPMHLGLMQGALERLRAPVAATVLEPFAEPAACLAHLSPVEAA
ncbi:helix-turn-helix transcriptional regulator [Streptomyces sp. TP-A0874]|uniref:helix-turn-helix transcriptional regulator n=1 Tax=Streptomyces sp. TP-A0874 TaxID=549819 RepID=UPI0008531C20|nr:helix-turn-helix domain-containing protein [Streptomyces sp. TP-A0874]